MKNTDTE